MKAFGSNGQKVRLIDGGGSAIAIGYHLPLATNPDLNILPSPFRTALARKPQRRFRAIEGEGPFKEDYAGKALYLLDGDRFEAVE